MLAIDDLQNSVTARMQRAHGQANVSFCSRDGRTCLDRLFQEGCAKLRFPRPLGDDDPQVIIINTAGGLTGGDRFGTEVTLAAGAAACVSTQACERIYRSTGADAVVANRLRLAAGARLAWLPQETIVFDGGRLSRSLDVDLAGDYPETLGFHDPHRGSRCLCRIRPLDRRRRLQQHTRQSGFPDAASGCSRRDH